METTRSTPTPSTTSSPTTGHASSPVGTVVVGVDGSESAGRALVWAVDQAVLERRALTVAHAVSPVATEWLDHSEVVLEEGRDLVRRARSLALDRAPDLEVHAVISEADPRDMLLDLSEKAALVVVGSHGRGPVRRLLLGSVGVALSRQAQCPLLVHRPDGSASHRPGVVVGIDGTEDSQAALEFAFRHASVRRLPLRVLHSFWDAPAVVAGPHVLDSRPEELERQRLLVAECIAGMGEKFPDVTVDVDLARGTAVDVLVRAGAGCDLLVVGTHRGGTLSLVLRGSIAAAVVDHATGPVAIVPSGSTD